MRSVSILLVLTGMLLVSGAVPPAVRAQARAASIGTAPARPDTAKVLTVDDYSRWRVIRDEGLSSDGRWVTWVYRHTNVAEDDEDPELHILDLETDRDTAIAGATDGTFSPDGRWIAFQVDSVPGGGAGEADPSDESDGTASAGGQGDDGEPVHRIELRELETGRTFVWHDMRSATFSRDSKFALLRDAPAPTGRSRGAGGSDGSSGEGDEAGRGEDAVLVDLRTGRSQLLGSVVDAAFNRPGDMLAYTVDADTKDANGLYVVDLASGAGQALTTDPRTYARMAWSEAGSGLAVLEGRDVPDRLHRDNVLIVVPDVRAALDDPTLTPVALDTTAPGFPSGWVISDDTPLGWSEDGGRVFFGARPQLPASDTAAVEATDSTADVDVWGTADRYVQSVQMSRADREREYGYIQAFDVRQGAFTALSDSTLRGLAVAATGEWAVGRDERAYVSDWRPSRADYYRVDPATGERTLMLEGQLTRNAFGISPDGRTFLYWEDEAFHAYHLDDGSSTPLGPNAPVFTDTVWDYTGPRPPWGVAGYTADGRNVIVRDRYDLWTLPLDGGPAQNITDGYGQERRIVLRLVRPEPIDSMASRAIRTGDVWDLSEPVTLAAFGELTKDAGFFRLADGRLSELVYDAAAYDTPAKAADADRFLFTRQTFTEAPDLRVSGRDFDDADRITDSNPHDDEYRWGRSVLFDFTDRYDHPLQGLLWLPDGYVEGERRAVIVAFYEDQSYRLNRYPMPELLVSAGRAAIEAVSRGYIVMLPDVHYHTGSSHTDQLDAVESATRKVIELGYADPDRIGLQGHSYAGEGAAFIGTQSDLFAGVVGGAGVTDLYTDFSQHWGWSYQNSRGSGYNGSGYYMYSQGRWGFSPWDRPEVYRSESALSHADEARQPFLIMHGTADPTVSFNESLKFYNALRFNEKTAWLLAYQDEGHHLSELGNRKDFTTRFFQFFGHYLRDEPAPEWMTRGVPYLEKTGTPEGMAGSHQAEEGGDAGRDGDEAGGP